MTFSNSRNNQVRVGAAQRRAFLGPTGGSRQVAGQLSHKGGVEKAHTSNCK